MSMQKSFNLKSLAFTGLIIISAIAGLIFVSLSVLESRSANFVRTADNNQAQAFIQRAKSNLSNHSPDYLIALAERSMTLDQTTAPDAEILLLSALSKDPQRPFAWALLSFARAVQNNGLNEEAIDALNQSLEYCKLCDPNLIRWRADYMIGFWTSIPHETRLEIFEGVDLLRWWHLDQAFITDLRSRALTAGIGFDAYLRAVDTPVRPEEIGR